MKILQLVTRRQRRGAEVFAAQLSDGLAAREHEVVLVGLYPPEAAPLTPDVAAAHDISAQRGLNLAGLSALAAYVRAAAPDVVQANGSDTLKYSSLVKRMLRGRWPLIYRNISLASYWLRYPGQRTWGKWLLRSVNHVVAVSDESRQDFMRTYGLPPGRVTTIRRGIHIPSGDGAAAARARLAALAQLPADAEILVHLGSLTPEKNHLWLLDAFAGIRRQRERAHLVLIGEGPQREAISSAIRARELERAVHLLGSRSDAAELLAGADLLLLCSTVEGIPGVILEAAACGVPSVSTDVGGVHEAVRHGETGLLIPLNDTAGFTAAVVELLADPERRRRLGAAALASVRQRHDMSVVVGAFEDLYRELARTGRSRA